MKIKTNLLLATLAILSSGSLLAVDIFDFGSAPDEWTAAPKNTALGQKALSYFDEGPVPLDQGRIIFNERFRYEHASQSASTAPGRPASTAFTLRTRIGYETPKFHGFYGLGEFENTWALNLSNYQSLPGPGKAVIADPRNNQLNQLFIGYSGFNSDLKGGRQIINLDNQRFVGAVAWRQNDQTFDAVRVSTEVIKDAWFSYVYNWQVNRIFGVYTNTTAQERFQSQSHFVNFHYDNVPFGQIGSYFYYLDLGATNRIATGSGASGSTAGLFYKGNYEINDDWSIPFRAEYAFQVDNNATAPSQGSFWLNYYHAKLGVTHKNQTFGLGFENLGGNGLSGAAGRGFSTPLATLHKFNGWADAFLATPTTGLRDYYFYHKNALPYGFTFIGAIHYFTDAKEGETFGKEWDVGLSKKFTENFSGLVKFAYFDGNGSSTPVNNGAINNNFTKLWVQFDFKL
ncbi:alginate export family protein [Rubellicoccus peritrichatus]|uniref:Alginate export family protein n=1 Tax=Rubellicoccus peritrichatus TaxID=3080537 RepID=A0AAQ3LAE9_9BACT|nr:alginate export family protein [Puniceicoccus sp. CR14]WOO41801.1 alginate export family protein [Puniceicoccus sp. CR14]